MATVRWIGNALPVKKVMTGTPANVANTNMFTATMNGKDITYTAQSGDDVAAVCVAVAELINTNEDAIPEFYAVSAESNGSAVVVTGQQAGIEWTMSFSASGGTAAFNGATTVQATGPHHWSDTDNWSTGSVPANSDDVWIDEGLPIIKYGLDQSAVTLTSLNIKQAFDSTRAAIGLPNINRSSGVAYQEYLETSLEISATTVNIGNGEGNGMGLIRLNLGSAQFALNVFNSAGSSGSQPTILIQGTHASNTVNVSKGSVGLGFYAGETTTVATLKTGYINNPESDSDVTCGPACSVTTVNKNGGTLEINNGATTINHSRGVTTVRGGGVTTANVTDGDFVYNSTGTLATLNIIGNGHADFSKDPRAKTITNQVNRYGNQSRLSDPDEVIGSLVIDLEQSNDLTGLIIGDNYRLTRGTIS